MHHGAAGPGQQGRHNQPHPLAGPGRRKGEHMFRPVMAQILALPAPQKHAIAAQQFRAHKITLLSPACRAIGRDALLPARAPNRSDNRCQNAEQSTTGSDRTAARKHIGRIGLIGIPPLEEPPGPVDRHLTPDEPWPPKRRLVAKRMRHPLRRTPHRRHDDGQDNEKLTNKNFRRRHGQGLPNRKPLQCSAHAPPCPV